MWRLTVFLLFVVGSRSTQAQHARTNEEAAVERAKTALASSLDPSLPKVTLEFFLNYESKGATIQWEVSGCGGQTEAPTKDREGDKLMCVEADFQKDQVSVAVLVSVGTFQKGLATAPSLFSVTVNDNAGRVHFLRRLSDLPKELHRPTRGMPRDLPAPTTASSA